MANERYPDYLKRHHAITHCAFCNHSRISGPTYVCVHESTHGNNSRGPIPKWCPLPTIDPVTAAVTAERERILKGINAIALINQYLIAKHPADVLNETRAIVGDAGDPS